MRIVVCVKQVPEVSELGFDPEQSFQVESAVLEHTRANAAERAAAEEAPAFDVRDQRRARRIGQQHGQHHASQRSEHRQRTAVAHPTVACIR